VIAEKDHEMAMDVQRASPLHGNNEDKEITDIYDDS
jgi:hypothetical protein